MIQFVLKAVEQGESRHLVTTFDLVILVTPKHGARCEFITLFVIVKQWKLSMSPIHGFFYVKHKPICDKNIDDAVQDSNYAESLVPWAMFTLPAVT